jgi:hypothetical protein
MTDVKQLEEMLKKARSARSRFEAAWFLNLAYYQGEQWIAWDGTRLYKPQLRKDRMAIVDNRIQPAIRTEVAKMTKQRPTFSAVPKTGDQEDLEAARLAEQLLEYQWKHLQMQDKVVRSLLWSRVCSAGFLKVTWDSTVGEGFDALVGPDGKPVPGPNGAPLTGVDPQLISQQLGVPIQSKNIKQGDISVEVRSPFQMFIDPIAERFDEAEWVIEQSVQSKEYVKRRWNVDAEADTNANPGLIESRLAGGITSSSNYKGVRINELWQKPNSEFPNGRRVVWIKDKVVFEDTKPYDPCPYVMFKGIEVPGRVWPTCIAEQLRGPQTELNKVKSQIAENRNRVGNPTVLASKQSISDPSSFEAAMSAPGGIFYYDDNNGPNAAPAYLRAPELPGYVLQEIDRIEQSFQEISGQHEVTSGAVPSGVTAASAINLLQESDDTRLGPAITDMEEQLARVGHKILTLTAKFYTDSRTIRIAGENATWQIFDFRGSMLRDNTNVQVQAGSAFPQSKAAKQAALQELLTFFVQSGQPLQGRNLAQFLKDWDVGGLDSLVSQLNEDEEQVNRENQQLARGVPLPINSFDNDQAHVAGHQDFMKSATYDQISPVVKQSFEAHVQMHQQRLEQQQMIQQQQMMGAPNGGTVRK